MAGIFKSEAISHLVKGLDASALRQLVHANNLSNVNTPGFKRSYVEFEESLKNSMVIGKNLAVTRAGHIGTKGGGGSDAAVVVKDNATSLSETGNNVDVDREMALLAMNQLYYNAVSQQVNDRLGILRYVINEGRR